MKTKIIATIGPASYKERILEKMKKEGMNIMRINMKHISEKKLMKIYPIMKKLDLKIMIDIKNLKELQFVKDYEYDYLAISFASSVSQIEKIENLAKKGVKIISKIENKKGVDNFKNILNKSYGIMIARGDLAKNISFEKVPAVQKRMIKECNKKGKFSITATEMLHSMTQNKTPKRSEVSDIANAIFEKSKALMLSEETAIGKYPALTIKVMKKIIMEAEKETKR
ncbi:MAG: pyruvate kinase [Candidatus Pacearchaeota archaeon]